MVLRRICGALAGVGLLNAGIANAEIQSCTVVMMKNTEITEVAGQDEPHIKKSDFWKCIFTDGMALPMVNIPDDVEFSSWSSQLSLDDRLVDLSDDATLDIGALKAQGNFKMSVFALSEPVLAPSSGTLKVAVIRVLGEGVTPRDTASVTAENVFTDALNPALGFKQCSGGKVRFSPVVDGAFEKGVLDVKLNRNLNGVDAQTAENWVTREIASLGYIKSKWDLLLYMMPDGISMPSNAAAYAYTGGSLSVYSPDYGDKHLVLMHEIGHSMGALHSGKDGVEYGDRTCMMGAHVYQDDAPKACFNGAKSWDLKWYEEKHETVEPEISDGAAEIDLLSINDYLLGMRYGRNARSLVKVAGTRQTNMFLMYNRAKGINSGTAGNRNEVTVVEQPGRGQQSWLVAGLKPGQQYTVPNWANTNKKLVIEVCDLNKGDVVSAESARVIIFVENLNDISCDSDSGDSGDVDCPQGEELVNNKCVASCPTGSFRSGTVCICRNRGEELVNNKCVASCPTGSFRSGTVCICRNRGEELVNNKCVESCPTGSFRDGDVCKCNNSNERLVNNRCVACPRGSFLDGNVCNCRNFNEELVNNRCVCLSGAWGNGADSCTVCPRSTMRAKSGTRSGTGSMEQRCECRDRALIIKRNKCEPVTVPCCRNSNCPTNAPYCGVDRTCTANKPARIAPGTASIQSWKWVLGSQGDSCTDSCRRIGTKCLNEQFQRLSSRSSREAAVNSAMQAKGKKCTFFNSWDYNQGISVCTSDKCCLGNCINSCSVPGSQASCDNEPSISEHSRVCPCAVEDEPDSEDSDPDRCNNDSDSESSDDSNRCCVDKDCQDSNANTPYCGTNQQCTSVRPPVLGSISWILGTEGETCDQSCALRNTACGQDQFGRIQTKSDIKFVAGRALTGTGIECRSDNTNSWSYGQGLSVCTSSNCCQGTCVGHCSVPGFDKLSAARCESPSPVDHSRICPCGSVRNPNRCQAPALAALALKAPVVELVKQDAEAGKTESADDATTVNADDVTTAKGKANTASPLRAPHTAALVAVVAAAMALEILQ